MADLVEKQPFLFFSECTCGQVPWCNDVNLFKYIDTCSHVSSIASTLWNCRYIYTWSHSYSLGWRRMHRGISAGNCGTPLAKNSNAPFKQALRRVFTYLRVAHRLIMFASQVSNIYEINWNKLSSCSNLPLLAKAFAFHKVSKDS